MIKSIFTLLIIIGALSASANLVVNGNFTDISHSKDWPKSKISTELPRVKNTWNLLTDSDPNLDNSPRLTQTEGIHDGIWYKIGSQRAFVKACYHNLSGNLCMGLGASDKGASRGSTGYQNISSSLNTTKKYTLKFKAAQLKDIYVGSGSAIGDNKTQVNQPLMVGLVDISKNHNTDFDDGSKWTNGIMLHANSVTLTTAMSDFVVVMDLPQWIADSYSGTVSDNQLKMALRYSIACPGSGELAQAIIDDIELNEFAEGDVNVLVGKEEGNEPGDDGEEKYTEGMTDYEKFRVNYRNTQEIIPSQSISNCYQSYSSEVFNLSTGIPKSTLNDNDYDAHKAYWKDVLNLAIIYNYTSFYPSAAITLADYNGKTEILNLIIKTVNWYFDNNKQCSEHKYHETYSYQDNGQVISSIDRVLGLLENEVKNSADTDVRKAINSMLNYGDYIIDSGNQTKGANYTLRHDHVFRHVYVSQDPARMDRYRTALSKALTYTLPEEQLSEGDYFESDGFYPDGMFFHHGDMCYWAMYGNEFLHIMVKIHSFIKNTKWEHSSQEWNTLAFLLWEGNRHVFYRGNPEYTSGPKRASGMPGRIEKATLNTWHIADEILHYAPENVDYRDEIALWKQNHDTIPEQQASDAELTELNDHKYFWNGDYQIHRRNNYYIAVRRTSQRVRPPESGPGGKGPEHLHYGSGYTPILLRGDEYRIARLGWNWLALPGTTNEMCGTTSSGGAGNSKRGRSPFSGGVQEGTYGCGAFIYDLGDVNNSENGYDPVNGAIANKSNFFFDEGMLCTGSGIHRGYTINGQKADIVTTINQMRSETDVYYAIDNSNETKMNQSTTETLKTTISDRAWFWHSNTGYVILAVNPLDIESKIDMRNIHSVLRQDEGWDNIFKPGLTPEEQSAEKIWMWQLGINHGQDPVDQKYIYMVLPNFSKEQTAAYCNNPKFKVESLGNQHVVYHKDLKMYQGVFFESGEVTLKSGGTLNSEIPVIFQLRKQDEFSVAFTAQNPNSFAVASHKVPLGIAPSGTVGIKYENPVDVSWKNIEGFNDRTMHVTFNNQRLYEGQFITTYYNDFPNSTKQIQQNELKINVIDNELRLDKPVKQLAIYDLSGRCMYRNLKITSKVRINQSWRGCFIIKTENKLGKVLLP